MAVHFEIEELGEVPCHLCSILTRPEELACFWTGCRNMPPVSAALEHFLGTAFTAVFKAQDARSFEDAEVEREALDVHPPLICSGRGT